MTISMTGHPSPSLSEVDAFRESWRNDTRDAANREIGELREKLAEAMRRIDVLQSYEKDAKRFRNLMLEQSETPKRVLEEAVNVDGSMPRHHVDETGDAEFETHGGKRYCLIPQVTWTIEEI